MNLKLGDTVEVIGIESPKEFKEYLDKKTEKIPRKYWDKFIGMRGTVLHVSDETGRITVGLKLMHENLAPSFTINEIRKISELEKEIEKIEGDNV